MNVDWNRTVRDLAVENPAATGIFEKFGIDYCCGGGKSLREACTAANIEPDKVVELLLKSMADSDWQRTFRHPELGTVRLDTNLALYAWHGSHHVAHITSLRERMGWNAAVAATKI